MQTYVPFTPAQLILDMDETVRQDWGEWRPQHVLVLSDAGDAQFRDPGLD
jgi:hypothetical protein